MRTSISPILHPALLLLAVFVLPTTGVADDKPLVTWTPESINEEISDGGSRDILVSLVATEAKDDDDSDSDSDDDESKRWEFELRVAKELLPFVSVSPATVTLADGVIEQIILQFHVPASTAPGFYSGKIKARWIESDDDSDSDSAKKKKRKGKTVKKALPVTIGVPPLPVAVPYTCNSSNLFYEKLFVRSGATQPMKGTFDKPFSTVSAALEYAARKGLGAVEVQVAPGVYGPDSAEITRPTRIVGAGRDAQPTAELALSIDHRSTNELGIQGVLFRPNGLEPGLTVRTDVMADDPSGHTALCNVGYDQVVGHAVAQVGGSISADDIIVRDTRRHPDEAFLNALSGTAFIFGGGLGGSINALLEDSFVFDSEGAGIVAAGFGTTVTLNAVAISGSQGCAGSVYVSDAAELGGEHVRIGGVRLPDDPDPAGEHLRVEGLDYVVVDETEVPILLTGNRMHGVLARGTTVLAGSDTFVGIDDLVVRNTSWNGNEAEECGTDAASSLTAIRGADITADQFILDASVLIGVLIDATGSIIFDEWFGSTINLSNGVVSNNPIAMNIQSADYDLRTLQDNVAYLDNDLGLDSEELPVPEPQADLDTL